MKKVAIFVDWDNLRCEIKKAKTNQKRTTEKIVKFNFNNSKHIAKIFSYCLNSDEEFYRICRSKKLNNIWGYSCCFDYFYDCISFN